MRITFVVSCLVGVLLAANLHAQNPSRETIQSVPLSAEKPPVLTAEQKQTITNALTEIDKIRKDLGKDIEIAQLKARIISDETKRFIVSITPSGFKLNDQMEFVPDKPPPADKPK